LAGSVAALALAGCSGGGNSPLTTSSVSKPEVRLAKPAASPACLALRNQIALVRQEGTAARVHAAATGKTQVVRIKRSSLAKAAELDRLNLEFQTNCSTVSRQQTATVAKPVVLPAPGARTATAAKKVTQSRVTAGQPIVAVPKQ